MIFVKQFEREHSLRSSEGCGIPLETQELTVLFDPSGALRTRTELDVDVVDPIGIHNNEGLSRIR